MGLEDAALPLHLDINPFESVALLAHSGAALPLGISAGCNSWLVVRAVLLVSAPLLAPSYAVPLVVAL